MPITDRNLTPGTQLVVKFKGTTYTAEVIQTEQGLRYQLSDGREFKSPSAAGTAITGKACNGWAFWSLAGEAAPEPARKAPRRDVARPRARKAAEAPGTASEATEGVTCAECGESFKTAEEATAHFQEVHPA